MKDIFVIDLPASVGAKRGAGGWLKKIESVNHSQVGGAMLSGVFLTEGMLSLKEGLYVVCDANKENFIRPDGHFFTKTVRNYYLVSLSEDCKVEVLEQQGNNLEWAQNFLPSVLEYFDKHPFSKEEQKKTVEEVLDGLREFDLVPPDVSPSVAVAHSLQEFIRFLKPLSEMQEDFDSESNLVSMVKRAEWNLDQYFSLKRHDNFKNGQDN